MNKIDYSNYWTTKEIVREYIFYYRDYSRLYKHHGIKRFKGTILDFMRFAHYKHNAMLIKMEEYNIFADDVEYDETSWDIQFVNKRYKDDEIENRIAERKIQKSHNFSKTNNNWNACKRFK